MADFQEDNFEQKLLGLKDTQESIQSLSLWCLKHSQQHKKIVSCWLHVLKKVKVEQRLTLFYLANDVIQYSKRKNFPFVESWATALQRATPLVREDKVKHKILRLFKIWDERSVYDETFLADLSGLLTAQTKKSSSQLTAAELIQEFQPSSLFAKIRKCKALEEDTDLKLKIVKECSIPVSDPDALQVVVKDRRNGDDLMQDVEDGIVKLEAYTKALELEIKERIDAISVLEVSEQFYDTQRGEAKVVCNAYRNFGNRIKTLKRKLEELLPTLPSPVPSPDVDAPSPSSESDIDIPEDTKTVCYDSEKSFIGTDFVTAMNNASENQSQLLRDVSQAYGLSDMSTLVYNANMTNNYDEYVPQRHMNSAPIGYYRNNSLLELESPASPVEHSVISDSFSCHEGNPIEVIGTSNDNHSSFNASGFLQNIMAANNISISTPTPVPSGSGKIPGLESPTDNARDIFCFMEAKAKTPEETPVMWGDKPLTKYQSWPSPDINWTNSQETPVSPPAFEKESFSTPVEYVDTNHPPVMDANGQFLFPVKPPPPPQLHHRSQHQEQLQMHHHSQHQEQPPQLHHMNQHQEPPPRLHHHGQLQEPPPMHHLGQRTEQPPLRLHGQHPEQQPLHHHGQRPDQSQLHHHGQRPEQLPLHHRGLHPEQPHSTDIDHRLLNHRAPSEASDQIATIPLPKLDVDDRHPPVCSAPNRNLISLTDSPSSSGNESWKVANDTDYRSGNMPMPPSPQTELTSIKLPQDNIESVDMELSDDEAEHRGEERGSSAGSGTPRHRRSSAKDAEAAPPSTPRVASKAEPSDKEVDKDAKLLLPPPNPWDMMNMHPKAKGDTEAPASNMSEVDFNKIMSSFANPLPSLDPPSPAGGPPLPPPDFPDFNIPPPTGNQPPPRFGGDIRFPQPLMSIPPPPPPTTGADTTPAFPNFGAPPPPPPPNHMQPPPNHMQPPPNHMQPPPNHMQPPPNHMQPPPNHRQPPPNHMQRPPNFGPRFGFMPNPMFMNNGPRGPASSTPTKEFQAPPPPFGQVSDSPSGDTNKPRFGKIEPLMQVNLFDEPVADKAPETKPIHRNLKEISLSDVLERSMQSFDEKEGGQEDSAEIDTEKEADSAIDHDLFSSVEDLDANGASADGKDEGADDLYNNIDESQADAPDTATATAKNEVDEALTAAVLAAVTSTLAAAATTNKPTTAGNFNAMQNDFGAYQSNEPMEHSGDFHTPTKQKTPFQAVVPKVAKPLMAPPSNFMEDDERCPWPLMPVIDLSNEEQNFEGPPYQEQFQGHLNNAGGMEHANGSPIAFLRQPGKNDFRPRFFGRGGGDQRFPSPMRGDMRGRGRFPSPRGDFRPRFQNRMPRTPNSFQRSQGLANFQNSPRPFRGQRPNRPFRRGWRNPTGPQMS